MPAYHRSLMGTTIGYHPLNRDKIRAPPTRDLDQGVIHPPQERMPPLELHQASKPTTTLQPAVSYTSSAPSSPRRGGGASTSDTEGGFRNMSRATNRLA